MSVKVLPGGAWECELSDYEIDYPLGNAIAAWFKQRRCDNVIDLGCGGGGYTQILIEHGIGCVGADLNPRVKEWHPLCFNQDITEPMDSVIFNPYDGVLCLEVGEHIPTEKEQGLFDNINRLAMDAVVLSWFPRAGEGIGHINEHPNSYVIDKMESMGFKFQGNWTDDLRKAATLWWFKESLLTFVR